MGQWTEQSTCQHAEEDFFFFRRIQFWVSARLRLMATCHLTRSTELVVWFDFDFRIFGSCWRDCRSQIMWECFRFSVSAIDFRSFHMRWPSIFDFLLQIRRHTDVLSIHAPKSNSQRIKVKIVLFINCILLLVLVQINKHRAHTTHGTQTASDWTKWCMHARCCLLPINREHCVPRKIQKISAGKSVFDSPPQRLLAGVSHAI